MKLGPLRFKTPKATDSGCVSVCFSTKPSFAGANFDLNPIEKDFEWLKGSEICMAGLSMISLWPKNVPDVRLRQPILGGSVHPMSLLELEGVLKRGDHTTLLVEVVAHDPSHRQHQLRSAMKGTLISFSGYIPKDVTVLLLVNVVVTQVIPSVRLQADKSSRGIPRSHVNMDTLSHVVELCAGMGCLGRGLKECGFKIALRCDSNASMLQLASRIDPEAITLQGDITKSSLIADICEQVPEAGCLAAGIACQPYSRLGDRRAGQDTRAQTLPATLQLAFLGRFVIVILECVPEAMQCKWVQDHIQAFCAATGYLQSQQILHLSDVWPARRTRWWCTLIHPFIGKVSIPAFPKMTPSPMVCNLLDQFISCNDEELRQLELDLYELGKFSHFGVHDNVIPWKGQMKTSLHSCGNQLSGCPCGCREFPFTESRLAQGGLHGLLVITQGQSQCGSNIYQNCRHIHPDELSLLNGMFPGQDWGNHLRFALCALGQLASPIQSCWIGSHIMNHLHSRFGCFQSKPPLDALFDLMGSLLIHRDKVFGIQHGLATRAFTTMINIRSLSLPDSLPAQVTSQLNPFANKDGRPACVAASVPGNQPEMLHDEGSSALNASEHSQHVPLCPAPSPGPGASFPAEDDQSIRDKDLALTELTKGPQPSLGEADIHDQQNFAPNMQAPGSLPGVKDSPLVSCVEEACIQAIPDMPNAPGSSPGVVIQSCQDALSGFNEKTLHAISNTSGLLPDVPDQANEANVCDTPVPDFSLAPGTSPGVPIKLACHDAFTGSSEQKLPVFSTAAPDLRPIVPEGPLVSPNDSSVPDPQARDATNSSGLSDVQFPCQEGLAKISEQTDRFCNENEDEETPCLPEFFLPRNQNQQGSMKCISDQINSEINLLSMDACTAVPCSLTDEDASFDRQIEALFMNADDIKRGEILPKAHGNQGAYGSHPDCPGIAATPGKQNAAPEDFQAGLSAPGIAATPGHSNAAQHSCVHFATSDQDVLQPKLNLGPVETEALIENEQTKPSEPRDLNEHPADEVLAPSQEFSCLHKQTAAIEVPSMPSPQSNHCASSEHHPKQLPTCAALTFSTAEASQKNHLFQNHPADASIRTPPSHQMISSPGMTATPGEHNAVGVTVTTTDNAAAADSAQYAHALGGVSGFETRKRKHQDVTHFAVDQVKKTKTHVQSETQPVDNKVDSKDTDEGSFIRIWTSQAEHEIPTLIRAAPGTTPGNLTQAEANLNTMQQPIAPRSWVNTHLPLHEPLHDKQVVFLHQSIPQESKCPLQARTCCKPEIHFPCARIEALWQQKSWVAQDEMDYYLATTKVGHDTNVFPSIAFFDDTAARHEAAMWFQQPIQWITADRPWISAAIVGEHWVPVVLSKKESVVTLTTTPEGTSLLEAAQQVTVCEGLTLQAHQRMLPSSFHGDCGFQAFVWILATLGQFDFQPLSANKAEQWRLLFAEYLIATGMHLQTIRSLTIGGTKVDNLHQQLSDLLAQHGVWEDRIAERTSKVIDGIPAHVLRNVLASKRPWAELKHAANNAQPLIKLIHPDELNAQITSRANQRRTYGQRNAKFSKKQAPAAEMPTLRASDLQVPQGVFKQQDGTVLGPLAINDVGTNSQGIVLVDQSESEALLKLQMPISPHGLAVIVLATKANAQSHSIQPIKFPALCLATQEPLIASGYMYQLGKQHAQRHEPAVKLAVEEHQTETVRCLVFQDQAGELWNEMQKQPVKVIFSQEPLLTPARHDQSVVIDVWDRQWMSKRFERLKPVAADIFTFSFRMMAEHAEALIAKSGQHGIYFEPRSECGRFPNPSFHVTWLQNTSFQEAQIAQQTSPHVTTLTRHGDRFGLRSDAIHAKDIHDKHRPGTPLLLGQKKSLYTMGPMPFSATKESITKLLQTWSWDARALQPRGRTADSTGISWTIQAVEDPSHWIYTLQHGDVLIARLREKSPTRANPVTIVASKKTIEHLQQTEDPWLKGDPWQGQAHNSKNQAATKSAPSQAQLASIEANMEKRILAAIQNKVPPQDADVTMEADQLETRVSQLERQLQQVHTNQVGLDAKVNQMQCQIEQQGQQFNTSLDQKLAAQMDKIEALFSKRGRHE